MTLHFLRLAISARQLGKKGLHQFNAQMIQLLAFAIAWECPSPQRSEPEVWIEKIPTPLTCCARIGCHEFIANSATFLH
jgi:hypothetical protein